MTEPIHEFVLRCLQEKKGSWPVVARETGISRRTIEKIARQEIKDPGVSLIERLAGYFRSQPAAEEKKQAAG